MESELPPNADALTRDLELDTMLATMAAGDRFLFDIAKRALLLSLPDPEAIGYRQQVLTDCLAQPEVVRELYDLAGEALTAEKSCGWASSGTRRGRCCRPRWRRWSCSSVFSGSCAR